jgi:signal peptidase II
MSIDQHKYKRDSWLILGLILFILVLDQSVKIWVKTHLMYGEMIPLFGTDNALIHFVENDGMAFGKRFNIPHGKLILSLFRLVAAGFLIVFLRNLIQTKHPKGLTISFALILAGALGNIIDSAFYGMIFSASYSHGFPAELFPVEGGYSSFLHGKVVDMFYFPIYETRLPNWLPFRAGEPFVFFGPVFNIADIAISWGVIQILLFHKRYFKPVAITHPPEENFSAQQKIAKTEVLSQSPLQSDE